MTTEAGGAIPRPPIDIRAAQQRIQTMQEGDVIELVIINGFTVSAHRTAGRTMIETEENVPVCGEAKVLAAVVSFLGVAGLAYNLAFPGDPKLSGFELERKVVVEIIQYLECEWKGGFDDLAKFLAKCVCH
jgi:hypothetical protein